MSDPNAETDAALISAPCENIWCPACEMCHCNPCIARRVRVQSDRTEDATAPETREP